MWALWSRCDDHFQRNVTLEGKMLFQKWATPTSFPALTQWIRILVRHMKQSNYSSSFIRLNLSAICSLSFPLVHVKLSPIEMKSFPDRCLSNWVLQLQLVGMSLGSMPPSASMPFMTQHKCNNRVLDSDRGTQTHSVIPPLCLSCLFYSGLSGLFIWMQIISQTMP